MTGQRKPKAPRTEALEEPTGFAFCLSTFVPRLTAKQSYDAWLDPAFHEKLRGERVEIDPRVGGKMNLFGKTYPGTITRLIDGACIELSITSKELGARPARIQVRHVVASAKSSKLEIYFWSIPKALEAAWSKRWWSAYGKRHTS